MAKDWFLSNSDWRFFNWLSGMERACSIRNCSNSASSLTSIRWTRSVRRASDNAFTVMDGLIIIKNIRKSSIGKPTAEEKAFVCGSVDLAF